MLWIVLCRINDFAIPTEMCSATAWILLAASTTYVATNSGRRNTYSKLAMHIFAPLVFIYSLGAPTRGAFFRVL